VVITDIREYRLELAKKVGIQYCINANHKSIKDVIHEIGMKEGFDVGLEMSGSSQAFNSMLGSMRAGGKIALLGILPPQTIISWDLVIFKGLIIKGIYGREMFETWYKMCSMLQSGLNIDPVITHHFPVDQFKEAFEIMSAGNSGKIILHWD
jgi:threonine 3-dehydrogenase